MARWWTLRKLDSLEPTKRLAAVEKLVAEGTPDAAAHLVLALSDEDEDIRQRAADGVATFGGPETAMRCVTLLAEGDTTARACAARALGLVGGPRDCAALAERLMTEVDLIVREAAAEALERLGWKALSYEEQICFAIARRRFGAAAELGPAAIQPLLGVVFDTPWYIPQGLVGALGQLGDIAMTALLAGPESHERWDSFSPDADRVRRAWRDVQHGVGDLRDDQLNVTAEIQAPIAGTLNLATDVGAHLVDAESGATFEGGPNRLLGSFMGVAHECPSCGAPQRGLMLDELARECLTRPHRLVACAACVTFYRVPASVFAPGCLRRLATCPEPLAAALAGMPHREVLLPDWGVAIFTANARRVGDPVDLSWDGKDPCPVCRSDAGHQLEEVRLPCAGCRAELRLPTRAIRRETETIVRCKRCEASTRIPASVWCRTCQRGLLPRAIVIGMTGPAPRR